MPPDPRLAERVRHVARPLAESASAYQDLLTAIGDARIVLIGEASHGTHEFYRDRALLTRRLIEEKGFTAVAAEADWPDAYQVDRYVRWRSDDNSAEQALAGFQRFPAWMWRNTVVVEFVEWLRERNEQTPQKSRAGFYGLDLYSLHGSIEAVLAYLDRVDPDAARRARYRYSCFEHFGEDPQSYGYAASFDLESSCERHVLQQLTELRKRGEAYVRHDGRVAVDEFFSAEMNARLVANAEVYYRSMFRGRVSSWNLRDTHMMETLTELVGHLERQNGIAKVVVWAHNSHLGDASATEMGEQGELNLGQLVRQKYGKDAYLIGFSTHSGAVTAASDWGGVAERKAVRAALPGSYEEIFHAAGPPKFWLNLRDPETAMALQGPKLQRAIGVIYLPHTERVSHYFHARLPRQFDAIIHMDQTRALEPLERTSKWVQGELPETYPFAV